MSYRNNEDAGDLTMMGAADASIYRELSCPECGAALGPAEDFDGADDGSAGDCPECGEALDWDEIEPS